MFSAFKIRFDNYNIILLLQKHLHPTEYNDNMSSTSRLQHYDIA